MIKMALDEYFEKAVEEEDFRQEFLDIITKRGLPKYVTRLFYNPIQKGNENKETLMRTRANIFARFNVKGIRSEIEIFPASFKLDISRPHKKLDDFLSTLEDHEYFHAEEIYTNPKIIVHPIYARAKGVTKALFTSNFDQYIDSVHLHDRNVEIRAIENQIKCFEIRDCSGHYKLYWAATKLKLDPNSTVEIII